LGTLQSQSHILHYITNKDLLIECVYSFVNFISKENVPGSGEGEAALFLRWGEDGVVWCHILIEIASLCTIVGNVFGCVMRSTG
jgi:hypothetical protein